MPIKKFKTIATTEKAIDCIAWNLIKLSFSRIKKIIPVIGPKTYERAATVSFFKPVELAVDAINITSLIYSWFQKKSFWSRVFN
jgi:hypothetical protein